MKLNDITAKRVHPTLPIFRVDSNNRCVLYTPGHIAAVEPFLAEKLRLFWFTEKKNEVRDDILCQMASSLEKFAVDAIKNWQRYLNLSFTPTCLTIYSSISCNMDCSYCFTPKGKSINNSVINKKVILAASRVVAEYCKKRNTPFTLVMHGGGEPTLQWNLLQRCIEHTRNLANQFKIDWFGYIATNGVLAEEKAMWLAKHFNRIGLSCDGPPDIQDSQRPLNNGCKSSPFIERTACIINKAGRDLDIRATITPFTMTRQSEIVTYIYSVLGSTNIRFEPAYRLDGKDKESFNSDQDDIFVKHFLSAQKHACSLGCNLTISGVRLDEIHGSYCNTLKNVLHLTSDGKVTGCLLYTGGGESKYKEQIIGAYDQINDKLILDWKKIEHHRLSNCRIPVACYNCLNIYHCVRGCPEICFSEAIKNNHKNINKSVSNFRCNVYKKLTQNWIIEASMGMAFNQITSCNLLDAPWH